MSFIIPSTPQRSMDQRVIAPTPHSVSRNLHQEFQAAASDQQAAKDKSEEELHTRLAHNNKPNWLTLLELDYINGGMNFTLWIDMVKDMTSLYFSLAN